MRSINRVNRAQIYTKCVIVKGSYLLKEHRRFLTDNQYGRI